MTLSRPPRLRQFPADLIRPPYHLRTASWTPVHAQLIQSAAVIQAAVSNPTSLAMLSKASRRLKPAAWDPLPNCQNAFNSRHSSFLQNWSPCRFVATNRAYRRSAISSSFSHPFRCQIQTRHGRVPACSGPTITLTSKALYRSLSTTVSSSHIHNKFSYPSDSTTPKISALSNTRFSLLVHRWLSTGSSPPRKAFNPFKAKRKWPPDFSKLSEKHQFRLERKYRRRSKLKFARPRWMKATKLVQWGLIGCKEPDPQTS